MCFAHAGRCRAQCDVLFIRQRVTILPQVFLSHFCAFSCSCSLLLLLLLPLYFLSILQWPKIIKQGWCMMVFSCFFRGHSEHNKIANTDAFGASEAQNRSIYFFLASGSKNHGFYNFDQCLAKTLVFTCLYAVFSMLQEVLFPCQRHKNIVNYSVLVLGTRKSKQQKSAKK